MPPLSEEELRSRLRAASAAMTDDPLRVARAVQRGRRHGTRRTTAAAGATGALLSLVAVVVGGHRPWRVVPAGGGRADVELSCGAEALELSAATTPARSDGVHARFRNTTQRIVRVDGGGTSVTLLPAASRVGVPVQVLALPPGPARFTCTVDGDPRPADGRTATLTVTDPAGYYVAPGVECRRLRTTSFGVAPPRGSGDPVALTRRALAGDLLPGDGLEPAGYPDGDQRVVRVRRDGAVLAALTWRRDGRSWQLAERRTCPAL